MDPEHRTAEELHDGLQAIRDAPTNAGTLEQIVVRPDELERMVVDQGQLDEKIGLDGDNWLARGSRHTDDGAAERDRQLTLMNSRAAAVIAGLRDHWALAGDQLYVDLDLSTGNLPAGSRLSLGTAEIEVSAAPHLGCAKFVQRFGQAAALFVNSEQGKKLNLRGINAFIVHNGDIATGDAVTVLSRPDPTRHV